MTNDGLNLTDEVPNLAAGVGSCNHEVSRLTDDSLSLADEPPNLTREALNLTVEAPSLIVEAPSVMDGAKRVIVEVPSFNSQARNLIIYRQLLQICRFFDRRPAKSRFPADRKGAGVGKFGKNPACGAAAERELSQLAAGGMTGDGWDDFIACWSGDALRAEPRLGLGPSALRA